MNIELNPKYKIGQKISEQIMSNNKLLMERIFIINNIEAIYDFKKQTIKYKYELKDEGTYEGNKYSYIYGWFEI